MQRKYPKQRNSIKISLPEMIGAVKLLACQNVEKTMGRVTSKIDISPPRVYINGLIASLS